MKKRVAILVGSISFGGAERVAAHLSEMLTDNGYEVYIFCLNINRKFDYRHQGQIVLLHLNFSETSQGKNRELYELVSNVLIVQKKKRQYGIDLTISFAPEMNLLNLLSSIGDKKIVTFHSCQSLRGDFKGLAHKAKVIRLCNCADKVVTVSQWCKNDLIRSYGIKKNKISIIYNPIEREKEVLKLAKKENIGLIVGRLQDIKQQWHAIRAFSQVAKDMPDAKLLIAGQGENEIYLKRLTKELGLEKYVSFLGFVQDIGRLYKKAKVVVFCSASEALPCSVLEAISYGVPVIAADCPGGIREILTAGTKEIGDIKNQTVVKGGILVPRVSGKKNDANVPLEKAEVIMAEAMEVLLNNDALQEVLSQNCIKISKLFYKDRIFKYWQKVLNDIFEEKGNE